MTEGPTDQPSSWNVDTLRAHLEQEIAFMLRALDERYATQTKALDAAFLAQQTAMQTAFTAADRAVQAALESAEKAVTKAEIANEKRFEATNEFRQQLNDQAANFMPRVEYESAHTRLTEQLRDMSSRLDRNGGKDAGESAAQARLFAVIAAVAGVVGILVGFTSLIIAFRI